MRSGFENLANEHEKSRLEQFCDLFARHGVEFIIMGGQAEFLYGSARLTFDWDFCYRRTQENLERLAHALKELGVTLRNAPSDLPFLIDAKSLALGENFTFNTATGGLDLFGYVEPIGGYDEVGKRATRMTLGDLDVQVIALDDLIRIKEHIQRPKDRDSLMHLRAIKEARRLEGLE